MKPTSETSPTVAHHSDKIKYVIEHTYNPDFTIRYPDGREVFIEAKGYFQDAQEIQKYPAVKECLETHQELIFVFEKPTKPIHFRSVRKDGTKMTHAEWAEKQGFRYYSLDNVGEILIDR